MPTTGMRRPDGTGIPSLEPGEYAREGTTWWANTPNGLLCNLAGHSVLENRDGTISVSPSILVTNGEGGSRWHGYLVRGTWSEC